MMVMMIMTMNRRRENFSGCAIEDWIGRRRPMPSKVKIAEPMVRVKSRGLKSSTVGCRPCDASVAMS